MARNHCKFETDNIEEDSHRDVGATAKGVATVDPDYSEPAGHKTPELSFAAYRHAYRPRVIPPNESPDGPEALMGFQPYIPLRSKRGPQDIKLANLD